MPEAGYRGPKEPDGAFNPAPYGARQDFISAFIISYQTNFDLRTLFNAWAKGILFPEEGKTMQQIFTPSSYIAALWRRLVFVEDFRAEIQALHIQELDRAFLATGKGMTYRSGEQLSNSALR